MSQASSLDNVRPLMSEYAELRELKAKCEARMKELDPDIRPALEGRGTIMCDGHTFELRSSKGRKSLDKKAVEAAGIDLEPFYKIGAPTTALHIKKVESV